MPYLLYFSKIKLWCIWKQFARQKEFVSEHRKVKWLALYHLRSGGDTHFVNVLVTVPLWQPLEWNSIVSFFFGLRLNFISSWKKGKTALRKHISEGDSSLGCSPKEIFFLSKEASSSQRRSLSSGPECQDLSNCRQICAINYFWWTLTPLKCLFSKQPEAVCLLPEKTIHLVCAVLSCSVVSTW